LRIDPVIPSEWDGFEARRRFRGATYHVVVKNPTHVCCGVASMTVDGRTVTADAPLPLSSPGSEVRVEVVLGT
jgi:cellobiose phosphorylase